jgi:hypothetical protein
VADGGNLLVQSRRNTGKLPLINDRVIIHGTAMRRRDGAIEADLLEAAVNSQAIREIACPASFW